MPDSFATFYPQRGDLKKVEKTLKTVCQKEMIPREFESNIPLNKYYRQYFGFKNTSGERIVLVQCFANHHSIDPNYWRTKFIYMDDGCNGVFRVKINLETGAYFDFNINPCA